MTGRRILGLALAAASLLAAGQQAFSGEFKAKYGEIYAERESGPLKADLYIPEGEGPFPGVLVVHGGAWRMGARGDISGAAQMLAQHGFTAIAISYRLAPAHKFPAQILDCKEAIRWMRTNAKQLKIDPDHIGGFGYSAGAHLVSLLGTTDEKDGLEGVNDPKSVPSTRIQCVACGGAPCDLRPLPADVDGLAFFLGGSRAQCPEQYRLASPAAFVTPDDPPMFFYHGEDDQLVPIASPENMQVALKAAGIASDLYVVPYLGHTAAAVDRKAIERSIAFLEDHLKPKAK
ncbi:alpha/beta hydrolase fold domain-containing protein [Lacipirellula sp.]|uniref:alpha/beta hydrolase fold domain-containing protein n=1 Tax=Lacipirellula sp. TaxID=2691419 RepID=UPI003D0D931A